MLKGRSKEYLKGTRRHGGCRLPLQKFLFSRVGRLWNDVHSELSQEFDRRTYAGYRFWCDNFNGYYQKVATNCWIGSETGNIYDDDPYGWPRNDSQVRGFYVHPFTGILCYSRRTPEYPSTVPEPIYKIKIDEFNSIEKLSGIWYRCKYKRNPYYVNLEVHTQNTYSWQNDRYIMDWQAKKQLGAKELRAMNLTNDPPEKWQNKVCEVCLYIDGNKSLKKCFFCETCDAWICDEDRTNWYRRAETASKKMIEKKLKKMQQEQQPPFV